MLMTYQVNKESPHQCCNELCSILIFLYKKINHTRHRSSLFAKRHARLACSLASVLTDGSLPLPPFGDYACVANISMVRLSHRRNGLRSIPIFLCRKISHMLRHSSSFAKRHTRFACSLVNALSDGSLPLPPFCECVFGANIFMAGITTPKQAMYRLL